jgi:hypothetical protein
MIPHCVYPHTPVTAHAERAGQDLAGPHKCEYVGALATNVSCIEQWGDRKNFRRMCTDLAHYVLSEECWSGIEKYYTLHTCRSFHFLMANTGTEESCPRPYESDRRELAPPHLKLYAAGGSKSRPYQRATRPGSVVYDFSGADL